MTGFEKMLLDKIHTIPILKTQSFFRIFGFINILCYGASHFIPEKDYLHHYGYTGSGRNTDLIRSNFGSNKFANVCWTAPSLIYFGQKMHNKLGPLIMLKFTLLAFFGIIAWKSAFNPSFMPTYRTSLPKIDSNGSGYYLGADQLAQSIMFFTLFYHKYWYTGLALMGLSFGYYGPMTLGGPLTGMFAAMTLI